MPALRHRARCEASHQVGLTIALHIYKAMRMSLLGVNMDFRPASVLNRIASKWTICWFVFFLSASMFAYRALWRAFAGFGDYAYLYLSSRAWLKGLNPYSLNNSLAAMPPDLPAALLPGSGLPYPPAIFPLYLPFASFDWTTSRIVFLGVSAAAYLLPVSLSSLQWERGGLDKCGSTFSALLF